MLTVSIIQGQTMWPPAANTHCTCTACCVHCLRPVINPNFEILTKVMYNTSFATVHYNVRDNSGRAVVIQYGGPNNLQWYENGAETPYQGAFANNPLFVPQTEYYNSECPFSEAPQPRSNCFGNFFASCTAGCCFQTAHCQWHAVTAGAAAVTRTRRRHTL